ncbi:hypothetical protein KAI92_05295 [Candidatus Parcubacteria bacterium]|nr:hypothetical protein [Candidatus Parcubacteria bacterium]
MKKIILVSIVSFVLLLTSISFSADDDWIMQAVEDMKRGNCELAIKTIRNHKTSTETAMKFLMDGGRVDLALVIWRDIISFGSNSPSSEKAEANYQLGMEKLITKRNVKSAIRYFTNAVSMDDVYGSYRKKVVSSLQEELFECINSNYYYHESDKYQLDCTEDGYIENLIDGIESFGAKVNSAKNYRNAMVIVNHPSTDNAQSIKRLDAALLFTFTDNQKINIGNRYLEIAQQTNDSSIYKKAEDILGTNVVNQAKYGASAKK